MQLWSFERKSTSYKVPCTSWQAYPCLHEQNTEQLVILLNSVVCSKQNWEPLRGYVMNDRWLTRGEVLEKYQIADSVLFNYRKQKKIRSVKRDLRNYLYCAEDLEKLRAWKLRSH